jgi:hypothetical protein
VVAGTPEEVAACPQSHTGQALREVLNPPPSTPSLRPKRTPRKNLRSQPR